MYCRLCASATQHPCDPNNIASPKEDDLLRQSVHRPIYYALFYVQFRPAQTLSGSSPTARLAKSFLFPGAYDHTEGASD